MTHDADDQEADGSSTPFPLAAHPARPGPPRHRRRLLVVIGVVVVAVAVTAVLATTSGDDEGGDEATPAAPTSTPFAVGPGGLTSAIAPGAVLYTAGSFVPPTDGPPYPGRPVIRDGRPTGAWEGYAHTGLAFDPDRQEKAAMSLFAPAAWLSVDVSVIGIAGELGVGSVRLSQGGESPTATVDVEVDGSYAGPLFSGDDLTWVTLEDSGLQFAQLALTRVADAPEDSLDEDFAVVAITLSEGPAA